MSSEKQMILLSPNIQSLPFWQLSELRWFQNNISHYQEDLPKYPQDKVIMGALTLVLMLANDISLISERILNSQSVMNGQKKGSD